MFLDVFMMFIGLVWIVISFLSGEGGQALAWFSVVYYGAVNYTNTRLEGSKYDPRA